MGNSIVVLGLKTVLLDCESLNKIGIDEGRRSRRLTDCPNGRNLSIGANTTHVPFLLRVHPRSSAVASHLQGRPAVSSHSKVPIKPKDSGLIFRLFRDSTFNVVLFLFLTNCDNLTHYIHFSELCVLSS